MQSRVAKLAAIIASLTLTGVATSPAVTNLIQTVTPNSAPQGTNNLAVTFTLNATPPPPGAGVPVTSATIGTIAATALAHPSQTTVTAVFNIPGNETVETKDVAILFPPGVYYFKAGGFTVTAAPTLTANFTAAPTSGIAPLTVSFTDTSSGTVTSRLWGFGDGATSTNSNPSHSYNNAGSYDVSLTVWGPLGSNSVTRQGYVTVAQPPTNGAYVVIDTSQTAFYNDTITITQPAAGQPFYGQDAQFQGHQPAYRDNGDGTVSDLTTGLMWVRARGSKTTWEDARTNTTACTVGGHIDWRMPTIKELYSLIKFNGANGQSFTNTTSYIPFIDTNYFGFAYGSGIGSERVID